MDWLGEGRVGAVLKWRYNGAIMETAVSLSIKNVPGDVAQALGERARANQRSLQGELMHIVIQAAKDGAARPRKPFDPYEVIARARALGLQTESDSVQIIRKMRDSR